MPGIAVYGGADDGDKARTAVDRLPSKVDDGRVLSLAFHFFLLSLIILPVIQSET